MSNRETKSDVILVGAGIMSATLGALLKELSPDLKITIFEKLPTGGEESSNEWNNAGTGHAAFCELNYTSEKSDGTIDISKAIKVNEQFQESMQFWSYLVNKELIKNPKNFIMPIPHMSMVQGADNVKFLKKRFETMAANPLFQAMEYSEDTATLEKWMPLVMENRTSKEPIAATKVALGTDVNFGSLTRMLLEHLQNQGVEVHYRHSVRDIKRGKDGLWQLDVHDLDGCKLHQHSAKFVFLGAGGGSLHLLQNSGIPEGKGIGGFPVSGLWLVCNKQEISDKHHAKIYGKAKVGAPPMSVPHLDTRYIDNKKSLLFGPFAGFSPKFLKQGSNMDLISSVKPHNLTTLLAAGAKEMKLTKYLIEQVMLTKHQRVEELREFMPDAEEEDWDIMIAGQRVQVIKDTAAGGKGTLQFGTEVVSAADGSIAALLGASPGASTAVSVMLEVIKKCFPQQLTTWESKIKEMIPSYGTSLMNEPQLLKEIQSTTTKTLGLVDSE